jgi:hypothetical protein
MKIEPGDPFDGRWEEEARKYRIRFWAPKTGQMRTDPPLVYESYEVELSDVRDVTKVVEWARANAEERTYTIYAVVDRGPDRGLVLLLGIDPTHHD